MSQTDTIKKYFHFEERRAAGTVYLRALMDAIQQKQMVRFFYKKDWNRLSERKVKPLILKEYKGRWYLFCIEQGKREIKTFALDRIESFNRTGEAFFLENEWDADTYFKDCFGIYRPSHPQAEAEDVVFEAERETANYLLSQPLHHSQIIVKEEADSIIFQIHVFITHDLVMELLSLSPRVKVLLPSSLRKRLLSDLDKALKQYNSLDI